MALLWKNDLSHYNGGPGNKVADTIITWSVIEGVIESLTLIKSYSCSSDNCKDSCVCLTRILSFHYCLSYWNVFKTQGSLGIWSASRCAETLGLVDLVMTWTTKSILPSWEDEEEEVNPCCKKAVVGDIGINLGKFIIVFCSRNIFNEGHCIDPE